MFRVQLPENINLEEIVGLEKDIIQRCVAREGENFSSRHLGITERMMGYKKYGL